VGCVAAGREAMFRRDRTALEEALGRARAEGLGASALQRLGGPAKADGQRRSLLEVLGQGQVSVAAIDAAFPWLRDLAPRIRTLLETEALYAGYLHRQEADIRAFRREEMRAWLWTWDYGQIGGLSTEVREKLAEVRPASLGAAARIQGMTPAALGALAAHLRRRQADMVA